MRDGNNQKYPIQGVCSKICILQYLQIGLGGSRGGKLWVWVEIEVEELIQHSPQHSQGPGREISRSSEICSSNGRTPKGQGLRKRNPFLWGRGGQKKKPPTH